MRDQSGKQRRPVLQDGKVVGVAFQASRGTLAQNVGYMIPTPVIQHFLADIKDGYYDHTWTFHRDREHAEPGDAQGAGSEG